MNYGNDRLRVRSRFPFVLVVFNMVLAVAKTSAVGAISEFHPGMGEIGNAAGCAGVEWFFLS